MRLKFTILHQPRRRRSKKPRFFRPFSAKISRKMALARPVFIVAAKRTPFGTFGGKLRDKTATMLGVHSSKAALESASIDPATVDSVIFGNVIQSAADGIYVARHIGLHSQVPIASTALTVNRLCGSGFQAIVNAAQEIIVGDSDVVLAGGTENMSQAPYAVRDIRWGTRFGSDLKMEDTLWSGLTDSYCKLPMAITAENLAEKYNISREDCDRFALESQTRWANAQQSGGFEAEISPMKVKGRKGDEDFSIDEHPRVGTDMNSLAKLPPVFKKDGTVTAGNASGICDGAASLILASEKAVKEQNLTPLARLVSYFTSGVEPSIMGIGPVPAIKGALSRAEKTLDDMDLIEVNEAFAAQTLAVIKELDLNTDKTNVNGGAIALGHPLASSGARITTHLVHELQRTGGKLAVGSACIGGGQGMAVVIENLK